MKIQTDQAFVASVVLEPFSGTREDFERRNDLFLEASESSRTSPLKRIDIFDESLLIFDDLFKALDYLTRIAELSASGTLNGRPDLSAHCGLCWGEYFIHGDQIYGPATNLATQLSFQSRQNEILSGGLDCQLIQSYCDARSDLACWLRDKVKNLACISLVDDDLTLTPQDRQVLTITTAGYRNYFPLQRNLRLTIGRSSGCDIILDYEHISRRHASIILKQDQLFLEDHSANGTYVYTDDAEIFLSHQEMHLGVSGEISCGVKAEDHPSILISYRFSTPEESTGGPTMRKIPTEA